MKILLVSKWGDSLDIAYQLGKEGNEVKMYIQDKANREIGFGFVQKTNHWERFTYRADLIVFDFTGISFFLFLVYIYLSLNYQPSVFTTT